MNRTYYTLLLSALILLPYINIAQESVLQKKISVQIVSMEIPGALEVISKQAKVDFTYNSDFFSDQKKISYTASNETLETVLKKIISDPTIKFKAKGNLVVLYRSIPEQQTVKSRVAESPPKTNTEDIKEEKTVLNVVYVYDTLITIFYDTLKVHDTVIHYDTITHILTFEKETEALRMSGDLSVFAAKELFNRYRENEPVYQAYAKYLSENTEKAFCNGISFMMNMHYKKMDFSTGLNYSVYRRKHSYIDFHSSVIKNTVLRDSFYYRIDTLDSYYKQFPDTIIWYHILDSSLVSKQVMAFRYDTFTQKDQKLSINKTRIIGIPLNFGFKLAVNNSLTFTIGGGLTTNFIIYDRSRIYSTKNFETSNEIKVTDLRRIFFTLQLETGFLYEIYENTHLKVSVISCANLSPFFNSGFPVRNQYTYAGISVGIRKYF